MGRYSGFTLIELIMVIVILATLSAFALPRFSNLTSQSNIAILEGLEGAISVGAKLVYSKSVIEGLQDKRKIWLDIDDDGSNDIPLHSGYPAVWNSCNRFTSGLPYWIDFTLDASCNSDAGADWFGYVDWNKFHFMPAGFTSITENCYLTYTEATSDGTDGYSYGDELDFITVEIETSGC